MVLKKQALIVFFSLVLIFLFQTPAQCIICKKGHSGGTQAVTSYDPNALTGPAGFGPQHYIPADVIIPYRIDFENDAAASAPAQQVDITNQLEAGLDWESFTLTEIGFGDKFIPIPPGTLQFETKVEMTYLDVDFEVHIQAGIDTRTGKVYAHFYSINPETGWPPPVEIGFLPPEDGSGRGMGHINYAINHKTTLEENSKIRNIALIVFDLGEQIYTNQIDPHDPSQGTDPELEAPVTLDRERPVSQMGELPEESSKEGFTVNWSGSDTASGIAGYNIYTRDSQETEWSLWLENASTTSATFVGTPDHTYEFYCVAIDNVGQIERKPPVPGAKIYIKPNNTLVGDFDDDGDVDLDDMNVILSARNTPATGPDDPRDLDGDGMITVGDARMLVIKCTRPRCAVD